MMTNATNDVKYYIIIKSNTHICRFAWDTLWSAKCFCRNLCRIPTQCPSQPTVSMHWWQTFALQISKLIIWYDKQQYNTNLTWTGHVSTIVSRANKRLYFLKQLKRAGIPPQQLLHFYTAVIRPVLEYASPVWHYSITALRIYTKTGLTHNF